MNKQDPFTMLLQALCENADISDPRSLCRLSHLDAKETARLRDAWDLLPIVPRRRLITRLLSMAEADVEVCFSSVFRLGLEDVDAVVRVAAIEGLWEDRDLRLVPLLAKCLLEDDSAEVQAAATKSLGRFLLLGELEEIPPRLHEIAYRALLDAYLHDDYDGEVRRRTLEALAYAGTETVAELIREAYESPEDKMRISAVFAMGRSADQRWRLLVQQEILSSNPELRFEAARACGELQITDAVPALRELIDDVDSEVREAALWALGQVGGDEARTILEHLCTVKGDEARRLAAEDALAHLDFFHGDLSRFFAMREGESDW